MPRNFNRINAQVLWLHRLWMLLNFFKCEAKRGLAQCWWLQSCGRGDCHSLMVGDLTLGWLKHVETLRSGRQLRWQKRCLCWDLNLAYLLDVLEFLSKTTLIRRYNQTCGGSCMEIIDYHPFLSPCVHCPSRFVILWCLHPFPKDSFHRQYCEAQICGKKRSSRRSGKWHSTSNHSLDMTWLRWWLQTWFQWVRSSEGEQ